MSNIKQDQYDNDGLRHGEWIHYWNNGQLYYRENYFRGIIHGLHESYSDNGRLRHFGSYNMGVQIGFWISYSRKKYFLCLI